MEKWGGGLTQSGSHSYKGNVRSSQVTWNVFTVRQEEAAGATWLCESPDLQGWFFSLSRCILPHFLFLDVIICPEAVCSFVDAFLKVVE